MNSPILGQRYLLIERLDQGGFGEVWKAADQRLGGKFVAVKRILLTDFSSGTRERDIALFEREALAASRLRHPNVVDVTDFFVEDGAPVIVMNFIEGVKLTRALPLAGGVVAIARLGAQIAAALAATHGIGLVHRDVKPDNVIVDASGSAVLVDFGTARGAEDTRLTGDGFVRGTMSYIAPELFEGVLPTAAADIWSLGATLYEMVQGRRAFAGPTRPSILRAILVDDIPVAIDGGPLADLISNMLDRIPTRRPSADEARQRLDDIARAHPSEPIASTPETATPIAAAPTTERALDPASREPTAPTEIVVHPPALVEPAAVAPATPAGMVYRAAQAPPSPTGPRRTRMPHRRTTAGVVAAALVVLGTIVAATVTAGGGSDPRAGGPPPSLAPSPDASTPLFPSSSAALPPPVLPSSGAATTPSVPVSSTRTTPGGPVSPPVLGAGRFPRAAVSTAIGDPPTADLCAAIGLAAMRGLGYTPTFSDRTIPPGCLIHMYRGKLRFNVGVYGDRPGTQASNPNRTTRKESGLTVYVYPFMKTLGGNCERDIAVPGATLHVYALSVTTAGGGGRAAHCAAADALTRTLAAAVADGSVPRLQLANPSLSAVDFCAALHQTRISDLPGFAGAQQPDGISAGCSVRKANLDIYFEFQLETALVPQATSSLHLGSHHIYASDSNVRSFCTFYSVQARTSGGRYERVSVFADAFGKHHPPNLCASTAIALARYLDTLGLR